MKIYTISSVHNEQDIIESLCRYHLQFCDGMIIYDSCNQDNTLEILRQLMEEGLNIHLVEEEVLKPFMRPGKTHLDAMIQMAFDRFGVDLVLPIDADEFLFCPGGGNPREVLESFASGMEYWIPWRTYTFVQEETDNTKFLPGHFPFRRSNEIPQFYKVAVSRKLWISYRCLLARGAHSLVFKNSTDRAAVPVEYTSSLFYAHYPIRSRFQAIRKCIEMEFILSCNTDRFSGEGYQYQWWFDRIMGTGTLTDEEVRRFSLRYAVPEDVPEEAISLLEDPPDISFADEEAVLLKYTDYSANQNHIFRMIVSESYRIICSLTDALRRERQMGQVLRELETLENFLRETSEEGIKKAANHIFEQVKLNFKKIENSPEQHLAARFRAVLSRVKNYLLNPQAP